MTERTRESRGEESTATRADGGTSAHSVGDDVRAHEIPEELGDLYRVAYGMETRPETLGEWIDGFRASAKRTELWPPSLDDLCLTSSSRHLLHTDEETHAFHCVLDVLMAPPLLDGSGPYEVESTTPDGDATITAELSETHIDVTPGEAVVSLGAAESMGEQLNSGFDPGVVYGQLCAYVNAFPTREDYEAWAAETPEALTMAIPMDHAFEMASGMVHRD